MESIGIESKNWSISKLRRSDEETPPTMLNTRKAHSFTAPTAETVSQSSTNQLYRAPQSSLRRYEASPAGSCEHKANDPHSGNATRRRRPKMLRRTDRSASATQPPFSPTYSRHYNDPYHSDSSEDSFAHPLDIPPIWGEEDEETGSIGQARGVHSPMMRRQPSHRNRTRSRRFRRHGDSDSVRSFDPVSTHPDDESVATYFSNQSSKKLDVRDRNHPSFSRRYPNSRFQDRFFRCLQIKCHSTVTCRRQQLVIQVALFLLLIVMVCDSKIKLQNHRIELQHMQEERAHILEQMTWIDHAAKKVHQHYGTPDYESRDLSTETDPRSLRMREELDQMQLRIQQNSREKLAEIFGEGPAQISLPLEQEGETAPTKLVISLSDDAPHAVSTFVQQVVGPDKSWDHITVQRLMQPDDCSMIAIQARTDKHRIFPVLEFLEKSRSCDRAGSVSLHQLEAEDDQFELLLLKVRLTNSSEKSLGSKDDICLGTIVSGLDALDSMLPDLPVVQIKGDREVTVVSE